MVNKNDEMSKDDVEDVVEEVNEVEEAEIEQSEERVVNSSDDEEEIKEEARNTEKKNDDSDVDAELDKFFNDLKRRREKQKAKDAEKRTEKPEKMFTQAEFEKALKSTLAKKLPPKEEMEQFKQWRESQQTIEEKMSVLNSRNNKLEAELESLKHENLIIKAGVDKEAVDFVQFNVEKMDGDFEENLENYLTSHKKFITPQQTVQKTNVVEGAEHKKQTKAGITKKELDAMNYQERAKYRMEHPEDYEKAMGR